MPFKFPRPEATYHIILPEYPERPKTINVEEQPQQSLLTKWLPSRRSRILVLIILSTILAISLSAGSIRLGYYLASQQQEPHSIQHLPAPESHLQAPSSSSTTQPKKCINPSIRKEWRTLSTETQKSYLNAIICLAHTPSILGYTSFTLYDDFPWVHLQMAPYIHNNSPLFLPWHRRFIHLYSFLLSTQCNFSSPLPYWDWTLDYSSFKSSPVFDPLSFGGDGNYSLPKTVGEGHCVTTGPLAGHLNPLLFVNTFVPHCLSRGFNYGDGEIKVLSPGWIEQNVLGQNDFMGFLGGVERGPHDAVPNAVGGDFISWTAAYDPLSILHHAQLDRLWLMWQKKDSTGGRFKEYGGRSLGESLWMGGLEGEKGDVIVGSVMNPEGEDSELCYGYE
ncbi:tyrosinase [Podospora fimiseda]|uniref:Tyrosinase n=1 Tax=Podospora fimiseda TaxID=252190 RepID=A0AAN7GQ08_9PEZI|nr:tyrosinase [Podospora fimiseda]